MSATATKSQELAVIVKGEIVTSNFTSFQKFVKDQLSYINYEPKTDIEFGDAEKDVKMLKTVEKSITDAKAQALTQMESVNELFTSLDDMGEEMRQNRLKLEKAIKTKKAEVKKEILDSAYDSIIATNRGAEHRAELEQAIKGKRNIASIQDAASNYVKQLNENVMACRNVLNEHSHEHGNKLIPDSATLELGDPSHLRTELELRVEKAKTEEERKQREKEESERKAEAERLERETAEAKETSQCSVGSVQTEDESAATLEEHGSLQIPKQQDAASTDNAEAAELNEFLATIMSAFTPVKEARARLKHPRNIKLAQEFAEHASAAYSLLKREGGVA